ncbi:hypothetical protein [Rahnella sp. ChDrAdgB13]|uniref:hypothetical protein n=1 Tax=Rahnella sp. ChDrAdgB13 TaxID=1850581 RepID=UPI001AD8692B|nr:hypothetical protein [Rahnella sp. ChDrAdgB13]
MSWERQKSSVADMPEEPSLVFWLIGGLVALVAGVLLFVLHANQLLGSLQHYNLWLLFGSPLFTWFVLICLRGWRYNNAVDKHEFEAKEAGYSQQQWTQWAGRYLAVMHSEVFLPDSLTPVQFISAAGREQHAKQDLRVDILSDDEAIAAFLGNLVEPLTRLPADLPLNVLLLTDSPEDTLVLQTLFEESWQHLMPSGYPAPVLEILRSYSFDAVERRIKTPDISAELILVQQMHGADRYSDALATLLLISDDVATKYGLDHDVRLLRPMSLESDDLLSELELYFSTQTQGITTQHILGDRVRWGELFSSLLKAAEQHKGYWKTEQLHWLETYAGICGPFSPWIMAAVVSDVVRFQQAGCLMLSESEGERFINTVITGNKNENSR